MANLKMVQVGTDMNNNPVYNVKDENDKLVTTTIMTEAEATAMINGPTVDAAMDTIVVAEETIVVPDYKSMTKLELEAMMREHGVELDRRKSKKELLEEVENFFKE